MKILLVVILAAAFVFETRAQQEAETVLPKFRVLSEMTAPSCEYVMANLDAAGIDLNNDPQATLFAIISPGKGRREYARFTAASIHGWMKGRRFDLNRAVMAFGQAKEKMSVEFILVPIGAENPKVEAVWSRTSLFDAAGRPKKATLVVTDTVDEDPCSYDNGYLQDLADHLKANPSLDARIVIKTGRRSDFNRDAISIRSELTEQHGIEAKRFRILYKRSAKWPKAPFSETEYWLIP